MNNSLNNSFNVIKLIKLNNNIFGISSDNNNIPIYNRNNVNFNYILSFAEIKEPELIFYDKWDPLYIYKDFRKSKTHTILKIKCLEKNSDFNNIILNKRKYFPKKIKYVPIYYLKKIINNYYIKKTFNDIYENYKKNSIPYKSKYKYIKL